MTYTHCPWSGGCNLPTSTDPARTQVLCRWHQHCTRSEYPAQMAGDFKAFESWLADMQHKYPSRGVWGWEVNRLWPVLTGKKEAV